MSTKTQKTVAFTGLSGKKYTFNFYPRDTKFNSVSCVYMVTKRYKSSDGTFYQKPIYVGETVDLYERFLNHHREKCFDYHGANTICVLQEKSSTRRSAIELDLRKKQDPPCNRE